MIEATQFAAWEQQAAEDGVELIVGALVVRDGRIFVQRRAYDRKLFPGCWDIVGGHVEEGEGLYDALVREVEEEVQWKVTKVVALAHMFEWPKGEQTMREYDFLVEVEGRDEAVLEEGKAIEGLWVAETETTILLDERDSGDDATKRVVDAAFAVIKQL